MSLLTDLLSQNGITDLFLWIVRIVAGVCGAFIGWFATDPVARIGYRLAFKSAIPSWSLPWLKLGGAALVGLLVYFFLPLGGGSGGLGFGPGLGGGPGKGPGDGGTGKENAPVVQDAPPKKRDDAPPPANVKPGETTGRKTVEIEVLGGKAYPGEERWYRIRPSPTASTLKEVEAYFKEHGSRLELHVVLTNDSPDEGQGIIEDLTRLANRYQIPSLEIRPPTPGS